MSLRERNNPGNVFIVLLDSMTMIPPFLHFKQETCLQQFSFPFLATFSIGVKKGPCGHRWILINVLNLFG